MVGPFVWSQTNNIRLSIDLDGLGSQAAWRILESWTNIEYEISVRRSSIQNLDFSKYGGRDILNNPPPPASPITYGSPQRIESHFMCITMKHDDVAFPTSCDQRTQRATLHFSLSRFCLLLQLFSSTVRMMTFKKEILRTNCSSRHWVRVSVTSVERQGCDGKGRKWIQDPEVSRSWIHEEILFFQSAKFCWSYGEEKILNNIV